MAAALEKKLANFEEDSELLLFEISVEVIPVALL